MTDAPLEGIRVVDMSWMWAGPYCSLQLAELGSEVIKLETPDRPDLNRIFPPHPDGIEGLNRGGSFNQSNQGKRSLSLDPKTPEGVGMILDRLGLGYDVLKERNPRLIMISLTG